MKEIFWLGMARKKNKIPGQFFFWAVKKKLGLDTEEEGGKGASKNVGSEF